MKLRAVKPSVEMAVSKNHGTMKGERAVKGVTCSSKEAGVIVSKKGEDQKEDSAAGIQNQDAKSGRKEEQNQDKISVELKDQSRKSSRRKDQNQTEKRLAEVKDQKRKSVRKKELKQEEKDTAEIQDQSRKSVRKKKHSQKVESDAEMQDQNFIKSEEPKSDSDHNTREKGTEKLAAEKADVAGRQIKGKVKKEGDGQRKLTVVKRKKRDIDRSDEEGVHSSSSSKKTKLSKKLLDVPVPRPVAYISLGSGPSPIPSTGQKYTGCHVSAAGGVWNAFENARFAAAKSFALFLRSQRTWNAKPLDQDSVVKWKEAMMDFPPHLILPHGSYLMNLGSPKPDILQKSRDLLIEELKRCEDLGIPHYNFHPGSSLGEISREECCKLIAESINLAHRVTSGVICVIENMSRQGFTVGGDFNEIRLIIENVIDKSRVGVCLDTCHSHAAGYDLSSEEGFNELLCDFGTIIGWQFLRAIHLNDSKGKAGEHQDRHENIGRGTIGISGFKRIMNCEKFNDIPLILETPCPSEDTYAKEICKLNALIKNK